MGWLKDMRLGSPGRPAAFLGGFDSLLQTFENCRAGLSDDTLNAGDKAVAAFFLDLYEREITGFRESLHLPDPTLAKAGDEKLFHKIDQLVRKVVIPAYARQANLHTRRERNDFYAAPNPYHPLERIGFSLGGVVVGALMVWAPFIPIWAKEWILLFALVGFVVPDIRRYLALRRYERELNTLVARAEDEIWRMDLDMLTRRARDEHAERLAAAPPRTVEDRRERTIEGGG